MKNNLLTRTLFTTNYVDAALLVLRVFAALMIARHGIMKISNFETLSTQFFDPIGLGPKFSLILSIAAELGAAIFILIGLLTRPMSAVLTFNMIVAAFIATTPFSIDKAETALLYLLIFLTLTISGPGRYSLDHAISRKLHN